MPEEELNFDSEMINVKRLIESQDMSELLFLAEYILVIVVKGERQTDMISKILSMSELAQTDLQMLIERAIEISVQGDEEVEDIDDKMSVDTQTRKEIMAMKNIERLDRKNTILRA